VVQSRTSTWLIATLIGSLSMATTSRAEPATVKVDIPAMKPGFEPEDFTFWRTGDGAAAEWRVVTDLTATGSTAVAQVSTDTTGYRFPLAVYKPVSAKNVEVMTHFKPVSGKIDQAGGIAVRLTTPDDYYVVRANALEDNVRFYRVVKGRREQIAGVDTKVTGSQWHTLSLRAEGARFTVSFDGKELFSADDSTIAAVGKVALWTKADSVTHFDNLTITLLP
jgi:glycosyl hydrolase family 59 (putative galactocerebrosidase)